MYIFYCPHIISGQALLSPEESAHCIRVLRLGKGDKVSLIDGKGGMYDAVIAIPDAKQCRLEVSATTIRQKARDFTLHLAIAPTKNTDRFEWFVEKAVEIGVDIITPLLCHRSERRILRTDRLHKLIIATMKQAMVHYLPELHELTDYSAFITSLTGYSQNRFIAYCDDAERKSLKDALAIQANVIILVGPEGDFTPGEVELAIAHSFIPVSLGKNRLRTETAGIVACQTVNLMNE